MRLTATRSSITSGSGAVLDPITQEDPTLDLNFADSKALQDDVDSNNLVTFSRASSATYVGADGLIKTTPVNFMKRSEPLDQWSKYFSASVTANATAAPDGTLTADKVDLSAGGIAQVTRSVSGLTPGATYTLSFYGKSVTGTEDILVYRPVPTFRFTLTTEWQRFTATITQPAGATNNSVNFLYDSSNTTGQFFIWGVQFEEGSVATDYIPTGSTISGAPRFDHDPVTNASLGLLIEEARTNQITNNWSISNTVFGLTLSEDTSISNPDGTTGAIKMLAVSGSSKHEVQIPSSSETTNHAHSVFVKKGNHRYIGFCQGGSSNNIYAIFDTDTKTITRDGAHNNATLVSSGFKEYGNGWFRIHIVGFTSGTSLRVFLAQNASQNGFENWDATGNEFAYTWGPQKEFGDFPASFIPTSGSSVTRAADVVEITGTNFSSFYNQSEGTFFSDLTGSGGFGFVAHNGSNANRHGFAIATGTLFTSISETSNHFGVAPTLVAGGGKLAYGYKANDYNAFGDGVNLPGTSPTTLPTGINELALGYRGSYSANSFLNGHIKRLSYFPTRLADATLQSITS